MAEDIGSKVVMIPMTVDQATFIILGLRQLHDTISDGAEHAEDPEADRKVARENKEIADQIERMYVERLQGNKYAQLNEQERDRIYDWAYEGNSKHDLVTSMIGGLTNAELDEILQAYKEMEEEQ